MKKLFIFAVIIASIQGCANYPKMSSQFIDGCEPEDITISNNGATGLMSRAWIASCKGENYRCYSYQKSQYIVKTDCDLITKKETVNQ